MHLSLLVLCAFGDVDYTEREAKIEAHFEAALEKYGPGHLAVYDAFFKANDLWILNYRLKTILSAIERMTAGADMRVLQMTNPSYYLKIIQAKSFAAWKMGDYKGALKLFEEMEGLLQNPDERFKLYDNMALTYATIGDNENALEYYAKAKEGIAESDRGSNYLGVGFVQHSEKNYTSAIKTISKAIELFAQGTDVTLSAKAQKALGSVYMDVGDFEEAERLFRDAKENFENDNPWDSPLLADCYRMLADALEAQNKTESEYVDLLYDSLKIRTVQDKVQLFAAFGIIQTVNSLKCEDGCRLRFVPLILKMIERIEGDDSSQAVIYDLLGQIYVQEHKMEKAKDALQMAMKKYELHDGPEDISTMKSNTELTIRMIDSLSSQKQVEVKIEL